MHDLSSLRLAAFVKDSRIFKLNVLLQPKQIRLTCLKSKYLQCICQAGQRDKGVVHRGFLRHFLSFVLALFLAARQRLRKMLTTRT